MTIGRIRTYSDNKYVSADNGIIRQSSIEVNVDQVKEESTQKKPLIRSDSNRVGKLHYTGNYSNSNILG